ncbi:hypothetical protein KTD17_08510 [Burkholderia multivorans]|nr:hypothetical protein [Burkholderia multivorans]MBU9133042.1 hypothetical protein [Burkholderia multivorans]
MSAQQLDFLAAGAQRLQMTESIELTVQLMRVYGPLHDHWGHRVIWRER